MGDRKAVASGNHDGGSSKVSGRAPQLERLIFRRVQLLRSSNQKKYLKYQNKKISVWCRMIFQSVCERRLPVGARSSLLGRRSLAPWQETYLNDVPASTEPLQSCQRFLKG
jgi:hypothetical protein